jgi:hypothetical protein
LLSSKKSQPPQRSAAFSAQWRQAAAAEETGKLLTDRRLCFSFQSETHRRMNYKDTEPYNFLFFKIDLLTDFSALCLTDFIDWRYISLIGWYFWPSL